MIMITLMTAMVYDDYCDDDHHDGDDQRDDGDDDDQHDDDGDGSPVPWHRTWTPSWAKADS